LLLSDFFAEALLDDLLLLFLAFELLLHFDTLLLLLLAESFLLLLQLTLLVLDFAQLLLVLLDFLGLANEIVGAWLGLLDRLLLLLFFLFLLWAVYVVPDLRCECGGDTAILKDSGSLISSEVLHRRVILNCALLGSLHIIGYLLPLLWQRLVCLNLLYFLEFLNVVHLVNRLLGWFIVHNRGDIIDLVRWLAFLLLGRVDLLHDLDLFLGDLVRGYFGYLHRDYFGGLVHFLNFIQIIQLLVDGSRLQIRWIVEHLLAAHATVLLLLHGLRIVDFEAYRVL
jgi:hypothetical protein